MRTKAQLVAAAASVLIIAGCTTPREEAGRTEAPPGASEIRVTPPTPPVLPGRPMRWRRIEATIVFLDYESRPMTDRPAVEHPGRVRAGEPLKVTIRSYGGGCEAAGGAEGWIRGLAAEVHPWDYTHMPEGPAGLEYVCTTPLNIFKRTLDLVFDAPGTATIRVHGLRSHGREPGNPPVVLTSTAVVDE